MTRMMTTLALLLLWLTAAGWALSLAPGGTLVLAGSGAMNERGQNDTGTGTGAGGGYQWINATMTSAILPSPNVITESAAAITDAYKGFDHNLTTYFQRNDGGGTGWVQLDCGGTATPTCNKIILYQVASNGINAFDFTGSNDGAAYTSLASGSALDSTAAQTFAFAASATYRYWKLEWTSVHKPVTKLTQVYELQLWGTTP